MNNTYVTSIILVVTALLFSRLVFFLFADPEGPNLLVVSGLAAILFGGSLLVNYFHSSMWLVRGKTRLIIAIVAQFLIASVAYLVL